MNNFDKKIQEEIARDEQTHLWMSFVGDSGFLGVIVTKALGPSHAIKQTHSMGINPGGEVQIVGINHDFVNTCDMNRLMSKLEITAKGYVNESMRRLTKIEIDGAPGWATDYSIDDEHGVIWISKDFAMIEGDLKINRCDVTEQFDCVRPIPRGE